MIQNGFNRKGRKQPAVKFPKPEETKVQQHFKTETDLHRKLAIAGLGNIAALQERQGFFADVSNFDLSSSTAYDFVHQMTEIFNNLPSTTRKRFGHDPDKFAEYMDGRTASERLDFIRTIIGDDKFDQTLLAQHDGAKPSGSSQGDSPSGSSQA